MPLTVGLIGDPVAHSLSPLLHNRMFQRHGLNAIYLPFRVPRGQLAKFIEAFTRRGIVPDGGGAYLLPRLVGLQRAKEVVFFADSWTAADAERIGLVNKVVPAGELEKAVKGKSPETPKVIDPLTPVTKDNVDEFAKKWDKWLGKSK